MKNNPILILMFLHCNLIIGYIFGFLPTYVNKHFHVIIYFLFLFFLLDLKWNKLVDVCKQIKNCKSLKTIILF
jgi:hypothetical protein